MYERGQPWLSPFLCGGFVREAPEKLTTETRKTRKGHGDNNNN